MQIQLSKGNERRLRELVRLYRKTCEDYNLSVTGQANMLLRGRLDIAFKEAEEEFKNQHNKSHAKRNCNSARS